mmetsp:Transcript_88917/g.190883  ORF Transcript_88917/g.190883 Transcript_88917/m.190883 type:complete len:209 (-) Transcript_88917:149-775(-)
MPCKVLRREGGSGDPVSAMASRYSRLKRRSMRLRFRCKPRGAKRLSSSWSSSSSAVRSEAAVGHRRKSGASSLSTAARPVLLRRQQVTSSCQGSPFNNSSMRPNGLKEALASASSAAAAGAAAGKAELATTAVPGRGAAKASSTAACQASFGDPRTAPAASCKTTHQKGGSCVRASLAVQPLRAGRRGCERARSRKAWSRLAGSYSRK